MTGGVLQERLYGALLREDRRDYYGSLAALPRIFALDPGESTGWAVVWWDPEWMWDSTYPVNMTPIAWRAGTISGGTENEQIGTVLRGLRKYGTGEEGSAVVVESFMLRKMITSDPVLLSPVRLSAVLDFALWMGVRCVDGEVRRWRPSYQTPADAKTVITDERLRTWEMYAPGPDHARDATRHALLHLRRLRAGGEDLFKKMYIDRERGY